MHASLRTRIACLLGLAVLLVTLTVWYGSLGPAPELGAYPDEDHLGTDYDRYVGKQVSLNGRVVDTSPVTIVAETDSGAQLRLTITQLSIGVTEGEELAVFGIVEADQTIRASRAYTVPQSGQWYAWTISFFAGIWVLTRLIRYWRIDSTDWTLSRRESPTELPLVSRARNANSNREDGDA